MTIGLNLATAAVLAISLGVPSTSHARGKGEDPRAGRCGTLDLIPELSVLQERAARMAKGAPERCESSLRPSYDDYESYEDEQYKFKIHYTTNGSDPRAVTYDDVLRTAQVMRDTLDIETALGYSPAPDDSIDAQLFCDNGNGDGGNGGNGYYDIYFVNEDNVYGYAQPLTVLPGTESKTTSFLALSTWILDVSGALEVTVAHEYFHAIQFNYDAAEDRWWMENTAVWAEEQVYDEVNDYYNYLPPLFAAPDSPLDVLGLLQYGFGIWPIYITEQHGQDVMLDIWELCEAESGTNTFAAQKAVLDPLHDGGWQQAVLDFRGAMADPVGGFSEGEEYPSAPRPTTSTKDYPYQETRTIDNVAAEYLALGSPNEGPGTLNICFTGNAAETIAKVYATDYSGNNVEIPLEPSNNAGLATVPGVGTDYRFATLVVTYATGTNGRSSYDLDVTVDDADCVHGEPATPGEEPPETATPGGSGFEDGTTTVCGGCVVVEPVEKESAPAAILFNVLWLFGGVFLLRRRLR